MKYRFGSCELDTDRHELRLDDTLQSIEPQVFSLLELLIENRDRVVSKEDLMDAVWQGRIVSDAALSSRVSAARQAVGDNGQRQAVIRTVPRLGFRFVAEVESVDSDGSPRQESPPSEDRPAGTDQVPATAVKRTLPLPQKPTLAVMPFDDISEKSDQTYFADGITEDIITALSKNRWLLVLARNSTISFREHRLSSRQLAEGLDADYLVTGSVRRADQHVRINVHLIDGASGSHIWAERYDRDIEDIFELQDEITETIAARIEPELAMAERQRARRTPPQSLDAWDHYLLGLAQLYTFRADGNEKAQSFFRQAIDLDPEFSPAYARLAYALILSMVYFDAEPDEAVLDEALQTARKAVALDDQDAVAHFTLGRVHLARGEYDQAIRGLEISLQLNPCLAVTYCGLGDAFTYSDRLDDAITQFEQAIRLSPHDPYRWGFYSYRSLTHLFLHEYEAAADWAERATQVANAQYWAYANLVVALGFLDRPGQTRAAVEDLLGRKPDFSCGFAREHLFYIKSKEQIDTYLEGLRRAGIPE
jgi:TolB-like protein